MFVLCQDFISTSDHVVTDMFLSGNGICPPGTWEFCCEALPGVSAIRTKSWFSFANYSAENPNDFPPGIFCVLISTGLPEKRV